jgi:hypothetical protein
MQSNLQYPNGDSNAITIRKHDYETLEPKQFLNDTILDFYLKYVHIQRLYSGLFKYQKTLNLYYSLFKCQKTMNHVILGTYKDNIQIHNFTSSIGFSTPNLFNARNRMQILQLCKNGVMV